MIERLEVESRDLSPLPDLLVGGFIIANGYIVRSHIGHIQMPRKLLFTNLPEFAFNGIQLLNNIRQHDAMEHVPVVMQTSTNEDQDIAAGMRSGAYYYLTKPHDGEVLAAISKRLDG